MQLQKGEKRSLADLGIGGRCEVAVSFGLAGVDIAAFGLDAAKKIGDDRYVVLFSNSRSPNGEITLASLSDKATFTLDLDALPATIDRVVFTATHDDRPIAESRPLTVTIDQGKAEFNVAEHLTVCRQNIWRRSRRRLAERGPRPGVDIKRRACGAASVGVRWSSV